MFQTIRAISNNLHHRLRRQLSLRLHDLQQLWMVFSPRLAQLFKWIRRMVVWLIMASIAFALLIIGTNVWVEYQTSDRLYDAVENVPTTPVALLLGTSSRTSRGTINRYFLYRIQAVAELYQAGKVQHIIASGDNHRRGYNEPVDMQKALMERGVPESAITLDYAGFRTLDSVVRAREIFSQNKITIVSQKFHNHRAVFIADYYDINAIGFNARDIGDTNIALKIGLREYAARFKAVLDLYVLGTEPRFLGEKVSIEISDD